MTLLNPSETDSEGNVRCFTNASAPHGNLDDCNADTRYGVHTRVEDDVLGTAVKIEGPSGDLILVTRKAIFLAVGIGITPFRSIVHWAAKEKSPNRIVVFYSNRRPEDAPFLLKKAGIDDNDIRAEEFAGY